MYEEDREIEEPYQSIRGLRCQCGNSEPSISVFSSTLPRVILSRESFSHSPNDWANIPWLLWCAHSRAGLFGCDNVSDCLGLTLPSQGLQGLKF